MNRLFTFLFLLFLSISINAQDTAYAPEWEQIPGPRCHAIPQWNAGKPATTCSKKEIDSWLKDVRHWRSERLLRIGFDDVQYRRPELAWTQSSFVQPQMMVHDRYFYDVVQGKYTIDRYLEDLNSRYGGIDSVLVWHTYPNIGIDSRNQYDLFRDLPGGIAGVKSMVDDFHRAGIRVLFPTMPWDQGTHPENIPDPEALSRLLASVGADGINGDTLDGVPRAFRIASDALGHPLALQPELGPGSDEMLIYNNLTWGYWKYDFVPSISRYKWLESRHMVNVCNRWAHNHLDDLQHAFFNGTGFESWENIWGIWNQLTPRDAEALRRIALVSRAYSSLLISKQWEPHTHTQQYGVFASKWPGEGKTLWTIVNRNHYPVTGRQLLVPYKQGVRYFDLWNGSELRPRQENELSVLSFDLEADGFFALLETSEEDATLINTLSKMRELNKKPLSGFSTEWKDIPQQLVEISQTSVSASVPSDMVKIPGGRFVFRVNGIEIEGMNDEGVDVQYPWESSARRYHEQELDMKAFWIDKYPVTNAEFKRFLDSSKYHPSDDHNFLNDWKNGSYPAGWENKPVTWISLEDARAYARWAGKRLPHEWEWQYAAQGTDGRTYPWGNEWREDAVPVPDKARKMDPASDVSAHPNGASPFGVMDMVGNVWQWTDEFVDDHTRTAVLRGGSHYIPQGSRWYFPQAYKLSEHGKYLLMAPSIDRSGAIGFRCVMDAK